MSGGNFAPGVLSRRRADGCEGGGGGGRWLHRRFNEGRGFFSAVSRVGVTVARVHLQGVTCLPTSAAASKGPHSCIQQTKELPFGIDEGF